MVYLGRRELLLRRHKVAVIVALDVRIGSEAPQRLHVILKCPVDIAGGLLLSADQNKGAALLEPRYCLVILIKIA